MSLVTHQFLLSVQDQAQLVKHHMRHYPANYRNNYSVDYDTTRYMAELCRVIFSTPDPENRIDYDLITAESILIKDGMDQQVVKNLTTMVFNQCIDTMSEIIPHIAFNPQMDVQWKQLSELDIMVTVSSEFDAVQDALNRGV